MADDSGLNVSVDENGIQVSLKPYDWIDGQADRFSDQHLFGAPSPRDAYNAAAKTFKDLLIGVGVPEQIGLPTLPLPPAPTGGGAGATATDALSPARILQDIVDGINAAESRLNIQNFVIASGSVEATLNLPAANVTLTFNVTPKPYN